MSEIGNDLARAWGRAAELAQEAGGNADKVYSAAKTVDWAGIGAGAALLFACIVIFTLAHDFISSRRQNRTKK